MKPGKPIKLMAVGLLSAILLTGCMERTPIEKQIYTALENVVQYEGGFEEQQGPLMELEQQEKIVYDEILAVGLKDVDKIKELTDEAIGIANQRQEHLDLERKSMESAEVEFKKTKDLIAEIDDEKLKNDANQLYDSMMERFNTHEELYHQYTLGIKYDVELYEMLQQDETSMETIEPQIDKINQAYQQVYDMNEKFNQLTNDYNDKKLKFYKEAGLNITASNNL